MESKSVTTAQSLTYTVLFAEEDGGFVASCPALGGLATQGRTLNEARAMAEDAILGYLESLAKDGISAPADRPPTKAELDELPARPLQERLTVSFAAA